MIRIIDRIQGGAIFQGLAVGGALAGRNRGGGAGGEHGEQGQQGQAWQCGAGVHGSCLQRRLATSSRSI